MLDPAEPNPINHADDSISTINGHAHNTQVSTSEESDTKIVSNEGVHNGFHSDPPQEIKSEPISGGLELNPARKRKLAETSSKSSPSRAPSPPWKKFTAEGPTSFVIDGKRKSSRTNTLPLQLQPGADTKRHTRAAISKATQSSSPSKRTTKRNGVSSSPLVKSTPQTRGPSSSTKSRPAPHSSMPPPPKPVNPNSVAEDTPPPKRRGRPPNSARQQIRKASAEDAEVKRGRRISRSSINSTDDIKKQVGIVVPPILPRIKLKLRMPSRPLDLLHPGQIPKARTFNSFDDWLAQDDPWEGEDLAKFTNEEAEEEASLSLRILDASRPGGALSAQKCSTFQPDPLPEPPPQYGHWDFVVAHAVNFQSLLQREQQKHRAWAKKLVHEAKAYVQSKNKTISREQLEREEGKRALLRYRQVVKDIKAQWKLVGVEVNKLRVGRWEEAQHELGKQALDDMLEESKGLLMQRQRTSEERESDADSGDDSDGEQSDSEVGAGSDSDDELTQEQLEAKYRRILNTSDDDADEPIPSENDGDDHEATGDESDLRERSGLSSEVEVEHDANEIELTASEHAMDVDEVDNSIETKAEHRQASPVGDAKLTQEELIEKYRSLMSKSADEIYDEVGYDNREDVSMSDDESGSDTASSGGVSDESSNDEGEDEAGEEDEEAPSNMLGFYLSEADLRTEGEANKPIDASPQAGQRLPSPISLQESEIPSTSNIIAPQDGDSILPDATEAIHTTPTSPTHEDDTASETQQAKTPQENTPQSMDLVQPDAPALLRGDLRAYQHDGLEWLANLWANGTNGILADEMGLGKTIQTIALLAHIAERGQWGPHLVVVPTSVMLNWEMEFKKWCPGFKILTYYGSQEERKNKRRGWYNQYLHTVGNVVITSYQLILQDEAAFKKRNWYYLILDEAHNIKNFQSQRWQALLRFKTQRRLLLTGTPLQNNIQELWSLLYFLMPSGDDGQGGFAGLDNFTQALKRPTNQILEQGRSELDAAAQKAVTQLHTVLRPYLLRRLKVDVEKQMPEKYEHVVYCRLSKRQRQLYDGFMGRADTRSTLSSGNYMSIMNCLMSLRKVCNHPDLFETRQIVTSFAMPKAVAVEFEIKELFFRKRLLAGVDEASVSLDHLNLRPIAYESQSTYHVRRGHQLRSDRALSDLIAVQTRRLRDAVALDGSVESGLAHVAADMERSCLNSLHNAYNYSRQRSAILASPKGSRYLGFPIYGQSLRNALFLDLENRLAPPTPRRRQDASEWYLNTSSALLGLVPTLDARATACEPLVQKFGCVTPNVVVQDLQELVLPQESASVIRRGVSFERDAYHEARVRLSIAFPDKRLLQYDCGKLQRLDALLRQLIAGGHRALIFTQMTKVLDILEEFLNMHNYRYLRLDGSTPVEKRQIYTNQFNQDTRIPVFILSSRSGGLGLNLTGADTVIFYDLDWNPAMDKQCQDRAHRIGQTRDVHIYRFVSEYTIETNILRKSNQKRLLDDVIIQKGDFTTDYFNKITYKDALDAAQDLGEQDNDASAAMDRVLGGMTGVGKALEQVEDVEDVQALETARKEQVEEIQEDEADFNEEATKETLEKKEQKVEVERHVDDYMVEHLDWELRDEPLAGPRKDNKKGKKGVPGARKRIR